MKVKRPNKEGMSGIMGILPKPKDGKTRKNRSTKEQTNKTHFLDPIFPYIINRANTLEHKEKTIIFSGRAKTNLKQYTANLLNRALSRKCRPSSSLYLKG